jgi:hypothetical protein
MTKTQVIEHANTLAAAAIAIKLGQDAARSLLITLQPPL